MTTGARDKPVAVRYRPPMTESRLLTVEQAAEYLGCGRSTVYVMLDTGQLPSLKIGKLRRISRTDLDDWIELRMVYPDGWVVPRRG